MTYPGYSVSVVWNSHLDAFSVNLVSRTCVSMALMFPLFLFVLGEHQDVVQIGYAEDIQVIA